MKLKRRTREALQGYAFIAPAMAVSIVFLGIASVFVLYMSFHRVNMVQQTYEWVGLANYRMGFSDTLLRRALRNTITFSAIVVPIQTFLALVVAAVLNSNIKFKKTFRAIVFLPTLTSSAALTMIFMFMFSMRGPVNSMMIAAGLLDAADPINFLRSTDWSMRVIMIMNIWSTIPMYMTLYLASLQELPNSMYEAASIDGATEVQKFFYITIPYLRPITTFVLLTGVIGTMQMFDQAFIFSDGDGGPASSTLTVALQIYRYAMGPGSAMGYASMIAICLMVLILTMAFIVNKLNKEERVY